MIINKIFGFEQECVKNIVEISKDVSISPARVTQIKNAAFRKLKNMMVSKKMLNRTVDNCGFANEEINDMI